MTHEIKPFTHEIERRLEWQCLAIPGFTARLIEFSNREEAKAQAAFEVAYGINPEALQQLDG